MNRLDVHTFIYFELASSSIVLVRYRPQFSRQAYSFLEVNQRRLRRNTWECKYDTREKNLSAVLANSSNHCRARRHNRDLKHRRRWISRTFAGSDFSSVVSCCYGYTVRPWWKVTSTTQDHIVWRPRENAEIKVDLRLKLPFFEVILMPFTTINSLKFLGCCSCSNVKLASSRWGRKFIRWSQQILEVSCQTSLWSLASTLAQGVIWKKIY